MCCACLCLHTLTWRSGDVVVTNFVAAAVVTAQFRTWAALDTVQMLLVYSCAVIMVHPRRTGWCPWCVHALLPWNVRWLRIHREVLAYMLATKMVRQFHDYNYTPNAAHSKCHREMAHPGITLNRRRAASTSRWFGLHREREGCRDVFWLVDFKKCSRVFLKCVLIESETSVNLLLLFFLHPFFVLNYVIYYTCRH